MTDISKYRNVSLTHDTYNILLGYQKLYYRMQDYPLVKPLKP